MRKLISVMACLAMGGGVGWGVAQLRIRALPWDGTGGGLAEMQEAPAAPKPKRSAEGPRGGAVATVDEPTYDFGVMEQKGTGKHAFTIKNTGTINLTLSKGHTTCKCTLADIDKAEVPPGESTQVTLEWHGKLFEGEYRQSATIGTNDPERPQVTLAVTGRILALVKAVPTDVVFSALSPNRSSTTEVKFFGFVPAPLALSNQQWLEPRTAPYFDVQIDPMPADMVQNEKNAKSGLILRLTVKPGLPIGSFRQTLRAHTNVDDVKEIELPIHGTVVGTVSVSGRDWDNEKGVLLLGRVPQGVGEERSLRIMCRGPDREKIQLKLAEVSPSFLQVEIGQAEKSRGTIRQVPLLIRIPKGSPTANHFGGDGAAPTGRILLETGLPDMPPLLIRVWFAVVSQ
jgi:hypothetical protein